MVVKLDSIPFTLGRVDDNDGGRFILACTQSPVWGRRQLLCVLRITVTRKVHIPIRLFGGESDGMAFFRRR